METTLKKATGWSIALSILMMVFGFVAIARPFLAGVAITIVVAWLLIFSGVAHIIFAWRKSLGTLLWETLIGLLYIVAGVYIRWCPVTGLQALALVLAIYLLIEGILVLVMSFRLRPARGSGWMLFHGIVTLLLAAIIWRGWPHSSSWVVGTLVGINMLFSGASRLMLALGAHRAQG